MTRLCIEHHYTDGYFGITYLDEFDGEEGFLDENIAEWFESSSLDDPNSKPSHLVIRRTDKAGRALSNTLARARKLEEFVTNLSRMKLTPEGRNDNGHADWTLDSIIGTARGLLRTPKGDPT